MLKSILNLKGAQELNNSEQESLIGGGLTASTGCCNPANECCMPNYSGEGCFWVHSHIGCF